MGTIDEVKAWSRRDGTPVTVLLVATISLSNLYLFVSKFQGIEYLSYVGQGLQRPWSVLTYPWAYLTTSGAGIIGFALLMFWLYWIGRSVERDIGPPKMVAFWFTATLLGALLNWMACFWTFTRSPMIGPALPIAAVTVLWCTRNPNATINVYMVIPVAAKWIGLLTAAFVLISFGNQVPLFGVLECIPLVLTYLYGSNRIPGLAYGSGGAFKKTRKEATTRGQVMYDQSYFDEVKRRETERAENERLKKLLGED